MVSRSTTSRSLHPTRPSSIRLILDSEARISHAACARVMPASSRNRRSWVPRIIRRAVGPVPCSSSGGSANAIGGPSWDRWQVSKDKSPDHRRYTAVDRGQRRGRIYPESRYGYPRLLEGVPPIASVREIRMTDTDTDTTAQLTAIPVGVDPTRASIARVYDAFLGGKDNYEIDREVLRGVQRAAPEAQELATENRGFLI